MPISLFVLLSLPLSLFLDLNLVQTLHHASVNPHRSITSISLYMSLRINIPVPLSVFLTFYIYVYVTLSHSLSLSLFFSLSISLSLSLPHFCRHTYSLTTPLYSFFSYLCRTLTQCFIRQESTARYCLNFGLRIKQPFHQ